VAAAFLFAPTPEGRGSPDNHNHSSSNSNCATRRISLTNYFIAPLSPFVVWQNLHIVARIIIHKILERFDFIIGCVQFESCLMCNNSKSLHDFCGTWFYLISFVGAVILYHQEIIICHLDTNRFTIFIVLSLYTSRVHCMKKAL
jgi:hypothetical protein